MRRVTPVLLAALAGVPPPGRAADPAPAPPPGKVVNPDYEAWCRFPPGTAVTVTTVGGGTGNAYKTHKRWRYAETTTLVRVTPDLVDLRCEAAGEADGEEVKRPPRAVTHPRLVPAPPGPRPGGKPKGVAEEREKSVTAGGKAYKARYARAEETGFDAEGSVHVVETWESDDVPGRVVRRDREMTGTYAYWDRVELTEVTRPAK